MGICLHIHIVIVIQPFLHECLGSSSHTLHCDNRSASANALLWSKVREWKSLENRRKRLCRDETFMNVLVSALRLLNHDQGTSTGIGSACYSKYCTLHCYSVLCRTLYSLLYTLYHCTWTVRYQGNNETSARYSLYVDGWYDEHWAPSPSNPLSLPKASFGKSSSNGGRSSLSNGVTRLAEWVAPRGLLAIQTNASDDDEMDRYVQCLMWLSYWKPGGWRQNQHRWSVHENLVLTKASQRHEGSNRNRRDEMMSKDTPSKWHEKKVNYQLSKKKSISLKGEEINEREESLVKLFGSAMIPFMLSFKSSFLPNARSDCMMVRGSKQIDWSIYHTCL